jgi:hypothetical protein
MKRGVGETRQREKGTQERERESWEDEGLNCTYLSRFIDPKVFEVEHPGAEWLWLGHGKHSLLFLGDRTCAGNNHACRGGLAASPVIRLVRNFAAC